MITPLLLEECTRLLVNTQFASPSTIQLRLRCDFSTAYDLLDALTEAGVLSEPDGSQAREVLYRPHQIDEALAAVFGGTGEAVFTAYGTGWAESNALLAMLDDNPEGARSIVKEMTDFERTNCMAAVEGLLNMLREGR